MLLPVFFLTLLSAAFPAVPVTLKIDFDHPAMITNAATALGGAIDGHEKGSTQKILSPDSVKKMLQAGLKPLAYRLRTKGVGSVD